MPEIIMPPNDTDGGYTALGRVGGATYGACWRTDSDGKYSYADHDPPGPIGKASAETDALPGYVTGIQSVRLEWNATLTGTGGGLVNSLLYRQATSTEGAGPNHPCTGSDVKDSFSDVYTTAPGAVPWTPAVWNAGIEIGQNLASPHDFVFTEYLVAVVVYSGVAMIDWIKLVLLLSMRPLGGLALVTPEQLRRFVLEETRGRHRLSRAEAPEALQALRGYRWPTIVDTWSPHASRAAALSGIRSKRV